MLGDFARFRALDATDASNMARWDFTVDTRVDAGKSGLLTEVQGCTIADKDTAKRGNMGDGEGGHDVDDQQTDGILWWVAATSGPWLPYLPWQSRRGINSRAHTAGAGDRVS